MDTPTTETEISPALLLDSLFDGVYCIDLNRRISYWNKGAERITGYRREEVIGNSCADHILQHIDIEGCEVCNDGCPLHNAMTDGEHHELTAMVQHKQGFRLPVQVRVSPVRNSGGAIVGAVEIFTDSNAMQMMEQLDRLRHDLFTDPLTDTGTRRLGEMALDSTVGEWQTRLTPFGILFLDIDNFKNVNDRYGHPTGDEVLAMVAKSIAHVVRKLDVVARWGGEEFIAILPGANQATLVSMAERIRSTVERSFITVGEEIVGVTISIGGTMIRSGDDAESIISRADSLMYQSKQQGRNRVTIG
ncbi:sensor domain-containing diguanylate cyclase [Geomonas sp. Red32]|uniref:sensor domain-containing diguanylate cyclase n=1 Tax=Geomonas sp. Red32 TaxID=2912856 RepID=UPI00202CC596|nr:sensor domain-containing diguanylate cyclase [Geomonas sp. Red32]MCM0082406.1 sensor domain-containing diguanylate cyclase [Geomonas sp. Red32]